MLLNLLTLFSLGCKLGKQNWKTKKAPGALYPAVVFPPSGCKIYITVTQDTSPSGVAEFCDQYLFSRMKTGSLGQVTTKKKNKKSSRSIRPRHCSPPPPPPDVKYVTVSQDKSPCLCSKKHDKYLFGRAKTRGLGQVTTPKKRKRPRGIGPRRFSPPPRGQNMLRSLNIRAQGV